MNGLNGLASKLITKIKPNFSHTNFSNINYVNNNNNNNNNCQFSFSKYYSTSTTNSKPGYLVALVDVTNKEGYKLYTDKTPSLIHKFGGKFVLRGPQIDVKEGGEWPSSRLVMLQFESVEAANKFYHSEEYQSIIPLRQAASIGKIAIVEGVSSDAVPDASI